MKKLSSSLIVKNEVNNIPGLIDDLLKFSDEVVIVDTGSTDGTLEYLAERCSSDNRIVLKHFDWIMDFAAARNYSLENTKYPYVFWCDADDRIDEKLINAINYIKGCNDFDFDVAIINYAFSDNYYVPRERIVNKNSNPHWKYAVHEVIITENRLGYVDFSDVSKFGCIIHNRTHEITDRNLRIYLNQIVNGETLDDRELYYYARELFYNGFYSKSYELLSKLIDNLSSWDCYSTLELVYKMVINGGINPEDYMRLFDRVSRRYQPRPDNIYWQGKVFSMRGSNESAESYYKIAIQEAINNPPTGFNTYCYNDEVVLVDARLDLLVLYFNKGMISECLELHDELMKIAPNHESVRHNEEYFKKYGIKQ